MICLDSLLLLHVTNKLLANNSWLCQIVAFLNLGRPRSLKLMTSVALGPSGVLGRPRPSSVLGLILVGPPFALSFKANLVTIHA